MEDETATVESTTGRSGTALAPMAAATTSMEEDDDDGDPLRPKMGGRTAVMTGIGVIC